MLQFIENLYQDYAILNKISEKESSDFQREIVMLLVDGDENVYLTGQFQGTADFDPGPGTANLTFVGFIDAFFAKYDASGNYLWAKKFAGTSADIGNDIKVDAAGTIYLTGNFGLTVDFDPGAGTVNLTSNGGDDMFIGKYSTCISSPAVPGAISGSTTICEGSSNTYSITAVPGASSYTWTLPGGWSGTSATTSITATAGATGGNITVMANNPCGSSATQSIAVSVNTIPSTPGTISGTTTICSASTNTYTVAAVPGATSYTWTLPSGWTGTSTTNSISTTANSSSGDITVTANNSCGSSSAQTLAIIVNSIPATPSSISGSSTICSGSNNAYSVTNDPSATSYTWTLPSGWSGTSTTNAISTTADATSGTISVIANNACGSSSAQTLAITVNTIPSTPGTISGTTTICSASTNTYSITAVPGATSYTWSGPNGFNSNTQDLTINNANT